jgi:hypothetical protein
MSRAPQIVGVEAVDATVAIACRCEGHRQSSAGTPPGSKFLLDARSLLKRSWSRQIAARCAELFAVETSEAGLSELRPRFLENSFYTLLQVPQCYLQLSVACVS